MFRKKQKLTSGVTSVPEVKKTTRETSSWFLLFALICAMAAGLAVTAFLRAAVPSEAVYVLKSDLLPGQVIYSSLLEKKSLPSAAVPPGALSAKEAEGKHARSFLAKGDILRREHILETSGSAVAAALLLEKDSNLRAVALPREASEGLVVEPGDRVDIYAYVPVQGAPADTGTLIVSSVRVVAASWKDKETGQEGGVTVAVPKNAAEKLAAVAGMNGKLLVAVVPPQN